ncbi:pilin glycosylation ligase domain-containing protein [Ottowia beijingensis]|jgi:hypothetical protein|uniref:pilin glycosylation ligase domain-containing protein n=1 Tax=Ottowia beijingensis TaxID=1207057 RepID=UPI00364068EC
MQPLVRRTLLACLLALPWLWPFTYGPVAATLPYLASAVLAALALALWPARDRAGAVAAVAGGWLAAALLSSGVALLQYFDLEAALFPWVNIAQPGQAFGNLRQPNQLASLLVMGLLALRWWVQAGRVPMGAALALGALLVSALAATASRVGLAGKWGQITISDFIRHMGADLPAIKRSWRSVVLSRASPLVLRCLRLFAKKTCLSGAAQRSGHKGFGGEHGARRSSAWAASRFHNSRTTMVDAGS